MACKYCVPKSKDVVFVMNYPEYSGIEISMHHTGQLRARYFADDDDNFTAQDVVMIKYCPMCGREL